MSAAHEIINAMIKERSAWMEAAETLLTCSALIHERNFEFLGWDGKHAEYTFQNVNESGD